MINSFSGIGRLGNSPELHKSNDSGKTASFELAINEFYRKDDDLKKKTNWIPCICKGRLAEIAGEFLIKGSQVGVRGPLKQEGKNLFVEVQELEFLASRAESSVPESSI